MTEIDKAEIFAVGNWNGVNITEATLDNIVENFERLREYIDIPIKLGHDDDQPLTDGMPALGWVSKVWRDGKKLFAAFSDVPDIVAEAINKKLYKYVSIELAQGAELDGENIGDVMTAVALLGAELPAVKSIAALSKYMTADKSDKLSFSSRSLFTHKKQEDIDMSDDLKKLAERLDALTEKFTAAQEENAQLKDKLKEAESRFASVKEELEKKEFSARKKNLEEKLEGYVKDGRASPAVRDDLLAKIDDDIEHVEFAASVLEKNKSAKFSYGEQGEVGNNSGDDDDLPADEILHRKAKKFSAEHNVGYSDAVAAVLDDDQALAAEYRKQFSEEVA